MNPLKQLLIQRITESGPMPFSSFMAAALYTPGVGYYASPVQRTGRAGDFYTSVNTGPVFGELMARQFLEVWERMGCPCPFVIIEAGANDGQFALDVLTWIAANAPGFYAAVEVQLDEPHPDIVAIQKATLTSFSEKVSHGSASAVECGCYFANELLDAVPCRRVRMEEGVWNELHVGLDGQGEFAWVTREPEDSALKRRLEWLGTEFPEGYVTEVAPAVASHVRLAAERLKKGYWFFADYGFSAEEYYADHRVTGTLRCYQNHQAHENFLRDPGSSDITAHVDFSLAATAAVSAGCQVRGWLDQSHFLTGIAAPHLREEEKEGRTPSPSWKRQFQTLTHPAHLGAKFSFLVLSRGRPDGESLSGLTFAGSGAVAGLLSPRFREAPGNGG